MFVNQEEKPQEEKLPWYNAEEYIHELVEEPNYEKVVEEERKKREEQAKNKPAVKRNPPSEHKPALAPLVHTYTDESNGFSLKYSDDLGVSVGSDSAFIIHDRKQSRNGFRLVVYLSLIHI